MGLEWNLLNARAVILGEACQAGMLGGCLSAAGFVYYRYGWKPALPVIALAILTDASRVVARQHTILQVTIGSLIAWGVCLFIHFTLQTQAMDALS